MKKFLILLAISSLLQAQHSFTLEQSLHQGLQNSHTVRIAQLQVDQAMEAVNEHIAHRLAKINIQAAYTRLSDVPPFEVQMPNMPAAITIQPSLQNSYQLSAGLVQPVFTGFRLSALQAAAEKQYEIRATALQNAQNNKAMEISEAFWMYRKAEIGLNLLKENQDLLEKHYADTEHFLQNGLATQNDLLHIKVQLANIRLEVIDGESRKELARALFNKSIGIDQQIKSRLSTSANPLIPETPVLNDLTEQGVKKRAETIAALLQTEAAHEAHRAAQSGWYPQIMLFANFHYANPNQRYMPVEETFHDSWEAGVKIQWTLWDWGARSAQSAQALYIKKQAVEASHLTHESVKTDIYKKYLDLISQRQRVEAAQAFLNSAEENNRVTRQKYDVQLITSTDLVNAHLSLFKAKTSLETAIIDLQLAYTRLQKAIGRKIYPHERN